jgi:glycosyltransferase involved in cell wall biosynthesis
MPPCSLGLPETPIVAQPMDDRDRRSVRVLQVVGSNAFAGTERHVLGLANELRAMNCEIALACPRSATTLIREAIASHVPIYSWLGSTRFRPDVVHVHDGRSAVFGTLLARSRHVALVRTQHFVRPASVMRHGPSRSFSMALHRRLNRRADGYIAVSRAAQAAAVARGETGRARLAVIAPGIRLPSKDLIETARSARKRAQTPLVASAGRLEEERRFDVLLQAIPHVRKRQPQCRFIIAGAGSAEPELRGLAHKLGVEDAVTWTGWLPGLDRVLMESHVYVNTWAWEGFGMATAEAMAFEMPVIAAKSGASQELVEDGITGRLVVPEDPYALAEAISELTYDRSRAATMGACGRERAENMYSLHQTAVSTLAFYQGLERPNGAY